MAKPKLRRQRPFIAWAIEKDFDWGRALLGRGWFNGDVPPQLLGCKTSLFATRNDARKAAQDIVESHKQWGARFPGARAVKVQVTVRRKK
jgi:hypothetical protein